MYCQNGKYNSIKILPKWQKPLAFFVLIVYNECEVVEMTLKELRLQKGLSQTECAKFLNIPFRTYCRYEAEEAKQDTIKYKYMMQRLNEYGYIDEEHGILTLDAIKEICSEVFSNYEVKYCYLFGSYAKGKATEKSDVDLLIEMPINGLQFYEIIELLREKLKKKVDLLDVGQLNNNTALVQEILRDGIRIYG